MRRQAQLLLSEDGQQTLDQYMQVLQQIEDLSPVTIRNYLSDLRQFIAWSEGSWCERQEERSFTPQAVAPSLLVRYREYLQTTLGLKSSTVHRALMSLKRYFAWTRKTQLVQSDPASSIKFVPKEASLPQHLDNEEEDALVAAVNATGTLRDQTIITLLLHTGLRAQELCTLTRQQIHLGKRNGMLRITGKRKKVNGQLSALRAFCAWLTEEHYLEINPAKCLKLVGRQEASTHSGLNDAQTNALLRQAHIGRSRLRNDAIIQVLLQMGICLDECSQLTQDDTELGERGGRITIRQGKGNKARVVPLNASARQALAEYVAPRLNCDPTVKAVARAFPRRSSDGPSVPLWQSQKKGVLTTSAMRQMIDVLVRNAAARGLLPAQTSAHTLRYTFARNYLAEHPGDIVGLASLLGHTSLNTTRIYSQPTIALLATRVEGLRQNAYGE